MKQEPTYFKVIHKGTNRTGVAKIDNKKKVRCLVWWDNQIDDYGSWTQIAKLEFLKPASNWQEPNQRKPIPPEPRIMRNEKQIKEPQPSKLYRVINKETKQFGVGRYRGNYKEALLKWLVLYDNGTQEIERTTNLTILYELNIDKPIKGRIAYILAFTAIALSIIAILLSLTN